MTSPNDKFKKLMFSFIDDGITSGLYGSRLYAPKKLWNCYILAIRAKHQRSLTNDERLRELAVFLDWCKLKGRPFTQTKEQFSSVRFTFFNALPKCRCLSVDKVSFLPLKNFSQYSFHPEKNYKYYLFTCEPRSLPDWPVNLIEEPIAYNDEQNVPHSPINILEQAIHEANIEGTDYIFNGPDNGGIEEIPELINHRNQSYQENFNNAISKVSNPEMMRVISPVAHAAKQDPPNANAVAHFPSQQMESDQVPLNSIDMIVDTPETPEYPINKGSQRDENYTPVSSPLDKTANYRPMRSDLMENASIPLGSRPLVSDAPLEFYTQYVDAKVRLIQFPQIMIRTRSCFVG